MKSSNQKKRLEIIRYTLFLQGLWTLVLVITYLWISHIEQHSIFFAARVNADSEINKDILYRRWNAKHGGVYVPVTDETKPNPYLTDVEEREIITQSGKELTLVNPAYMTRQVHEIGFKTDGVRGHITSLNPIRPQNEADIWEKKALEAFETGETSYSSIEILDGQEYMRYMKPLVTEKGCLKCHARQGYKIGDIRGGISVAVPMKPYKEMNTKRNYVIAGTHGILWIIGLFAISLGGQRIKLKENQRKRAEEEILESENKFKSLIEQSKDAIFIFINGKMDFVNPGFLELLGIDSDEAFSPEFDFLEFIIENERENIRLCMNSILNGQNKYCNSNYRLIDKKGEIKNIQGSATGIRYKNKNALMATLRDVTDQRRLEDQLRQSQKIESVGYLAGGIAHDFNNLLTPIIGNAELAMMELNKDSGFYREFQEIHETALRASNLVRQILAFSRKQVLDVKKVDLNNLIKGFRKILNRTIREDVQININYGNLDNHFVQVDVSQIEQILLNLCVNAQDAMPDGGLIFIETDVVFLDSEYVEKHSGVKTGNYIMLAVTDSGQGIDRVTVQKIFDPFFTTKDVNKGTGLGLSTVYGIIKQHEGHIWVYSEPGKGTSFKLYFPVFESDENNELLAEKKEIRHKKGSGTIIIVEDQEQVRNVAERILRKYGYKVYLASNGEEAVKILLDENTKVDLMLTDVIMPGINGKELFNRLKQEIPDLKVIYMSGYTRNAIKHHGVLDDDFEFIQKPLMIDVLLEKVQKILY